MTVMDSFALLAQIPKEDFAIFSAILGLFLGSFYNVCADRYLAGQSILWPPSHCEACQTPLKPWELIPVVSWVCLRGRCVHCGEKVSFQYPLAELISALLAYFVGLRFGVSFAYLTVLIFTGLFLILSLIDFKAYLLPDRFTLPGAVIAIFASVYGLGNAWIDVLLGALVGGGLFGALAWGYKRLRGIDGLGWGDVKLMFMLGALCTFPYLSMMIFLAGVLALVGFAVVGVAKKRTEDVHSMALPFGPFLCMGAWVTLLWGPMLWQMWFNWIVG